MTSLQRQIKYGSLMDVLIKQMVSLINISISGKLVIVVSSLVELHCMKVMSKEHANMELKLYLIHRHQENKDKEAHQLHDSGKFGIAVVYIGILRQLLMILMRINTVKISSMHLLNLID